jgi:transcriptional regulator with XRE-family HTH domain
MGSSKLGKYIIEARTKQGVSQRKLAELSNLTNSTISRIESDTVMPDAKTLVKIAGALNIDKEILLGKCGYSDLHDDVIVIARKAGEVSPDKRKDLLNVLNETIDRYLEA